MSLVQDALFLASRKDYSEDQPRAENGQFGEGSGTHKDPKVREHLEKSAGKNFGARHAEFVKALETSTFDVNNPAVQGESGSVEHQLSVERVMGDRANPGQIYEHWSHGRDQAEKQAEHAAYLSKTAEVHVMSKTGKMGKPERIGKEELQKPWIEGTHIHETEVKLESSGHDRDDRPGPKVEIVTFKIGHELPTGTVVGKRVVEGKTTQYAVKPRSAAAEKKYQKGLLLSTDVLDR